MAVHRAHLLLLAMLALCISSSSANAWTHPTGRRSGAARLLGLGEAWEADGELDGSSKAHGIGGWLSAAAPESPSGGGVDAVVGGGAGPSAPRGSAAGLQGGLLPVAAWPQPWPVPGGVQGLQGLQGGQAGPPQEQQLVNTVGGLDLLVDGHLRFLGAQHRAIPRHLHGFGERGRAQRPQQLLQQPAGEHRVHGEHDPGGAALGAGGRGQPAATATSRSRAAHVSSGPHDVPAPPASVLPDQALRGDERASRAAALQQPRPRAAVDGARPLETHRALRRPASTAPLVPVIGSAPRFRQKRPFLSSREDDSLGTCRGTTENRCHNSITYFFSKLQFKKNFLLNSSFCEVAVCLKFLFYLQICKWFVGHLHCARPRRCPVCPPNSSFSSVLIPRGLHSAHAHGALQSFTVTLRTSRLRTSCNLFFSSASVLILGLHVRAAVRQAVRRTACRRVTPPPLQSSSRLPLPSSPLATRTISRRVVKYHSRCRARAGSEAGTGMERGRLRGKGEGVATGPRPTMPLDVLVVSGRCFIPRFLSTSLYF